MRSLIVVAVSCVWFVGCTFGVRPCQASSECEAGAVCRDSLCVLLDAGTAGAGGGSTGGGGGTGGASGCSPACAEWQNCAPTGCVTARVEAVSPDSGTEYSGGEAVRFVFRVLNWDGGVWPSATIPASTSGGITGPATLAKTGNTFEGDFVLANTTGVQEVRAGWPAAEAGIRVMALTCNASCPPWEGCVADRDGGSCVDLGVSLSWLLPSTGQQFGPRDFARVPLELTAMRSGGGAFAVDIPYWVSGGASGALMKNGTSWLGALDGGTASGLRTVWAGWDGGPVASRDFEVVLSAPMVRLMAEPPPMRPMQDTDADGVPRWKKSEMALVRLESNRSMLATSVAFTVPGVTRVADSACSTCGDVACLCFGVALSRQAMPVGVGQVSVGVTSGEDALGNAFPAVVPVALPVTRLKWVRVLAASPSTAPLALALTSSGVVVAGAKTGVFGAQLWNVTPDGGATSVWTSVTEGVTAGPLVGGQQDTYLATASATQSQLVKNPGASQVVRCGVIATGTYDGDLALQAPGASEVVYAVRSDGVLAAGQGSCIPTMIDDGMSGSLAGRPTIAIQANDVFLAGGGSAPVWKFLATAANPSPRGWLTTTTLFPSSLFLIGSGIAGGGGGPTVGGVFGFVNPSGSLDGGTTTNATPGTSPGGAAVIGGIVGSALVYYGDNAGRVRRVDISGGTGVSFASPIASAQVGSVRFSDRAPLLGDGGKVYVIGSDGVLRVLGALTLVEEWNWPGLFPASAPAAAISQLSLDLDRSVAMPCSTSQPGVLYVASTSAGVTRLHALLVDSRGVDRLAPWPRHQHNPANTGNSATGLVPWTCP